MAFERWLTSISHMKESVRFIRVDGVKTATDVPSMDDHYELVELDCLHDNVDVSLGYAMRRCPKSRIEFQLFGPWYAYLATLLHVTCTCDGTVERVNLVDYPSLSLANTDLNSIERFIVQLFEEAEKTSCSLMPDVYWGGAA